jgi:hypothetical protein
VPDPGRWFLTFAAFGGQGRPWGDGTTMASRAAHGVDPWDPGCEVTTIIGGYPAMAAIRDVFEQAIADARASAAPSGQQGYVCISGWCLNPQRELGDLFGPWPPGSAPAADQTAIGRAAVGDPHARGGGDGPANNPNRAAGRSFARGYLTSIRPSLAAWIAPPMVMAQAAWPCFSWKRWWYSSAR